MGIHDLDHSRIPTLHCLSHTALDKDHAYHVGSSWIFVHIYGSLRPFYICDHSYEIQICHSLTFCKRVEKNTLVPQGLHIMPLASDHPRLNWDFPQGLWWACAGAPFAQNIKYILRMASILGGLVRLQSCQQELIITSCVCCIKILHALRFSFRMGIFWF